MLLSEIVKRSLDYNNTEIKDSQIMEDYCKFIIDNVKIKSYLTLVEKNLIVERILGYVAMMDLDAISPSDFVSNLEYRLFVDGLLKYTDIKLDEEYRKITAYDILMEAEFDQIILSVCSADFSRLRMMIKEGMDYSFNLDLRKVITGLNGNKMAKTVKEIKEILSDTETIGKLHDISIMNDSSVARLKTEIEKLDTQALLDTLKSIPTNKKSDVNEVQE